MKRSKFIDSQIMDTLKRVDTGLAVLEVSRELGISAATFYLTCLVLSDQFHLETLAPVINSFCHPATNSVGV
jgi:hypothetical protein